MEEEDLRLIRQITRETIAEILDTEVWDAIFELVNAFEAGITAFNKRLGQQKGIAQKPAWNPDNIRWEQAEGKNGPYERSEDMDNPEFKAMLRDLVKHDGKLTRNGYFYWRFKNGSAVCRKRRG